MTKIFYSGAWDLFHYGHLRALRAARRLGDWLTVGVITDDYEHWFATNYKERPIISYEQRTEIVASLRCVDQVLPHRSIGDNVDFIIKEGFSIRAHGPEHGAWLQQVITRNYLELMGVKYVLIPRTPNISTTMIKERIKHEKVSSNSDRRDCDGCSGGVPASSDRTTQICSHSSR